MILKVFKNSARKIFILTFILGLIVNLGLSSKQAEAQIPVIDAANLTVNTTTAVATVAQKIMYNLKEFVIYPLVRKIANSLENKLVNKINGTLSNINGKGPTFITNWRNHLLGSQARGNDVFRAVLADAEVCGYMKNSVLNAFGAEKSIGVIEGAKIRDASGRVVFENKTGIPGLPSFQNLANCTLPSNFNAPTFRTDFAKGGGWDTWNKLIQPQNNFYGVYAAALREQAKQIDTEKTTTMDSAVAGQGFLSQKLGVGNSGLGPSGCAQVAIQGPAMPGTAPLDTVTRCAFMGKEVTPAKLLGETTANALDKKLGRVGGATQITDIVLSLASAVLNATTNRLVNFLGQNTYDRPPSQDAGGYPEEQVAPGSGDPQYDAGQICQNDCVRAREATCSSGSDANDCVETDPETGACQRTGYDDCISQAQSECNAQCTSAASPNY